MRYDKQTRYAVESGCHCVEILSDVPLQGESTMGRPHAKHLVTNVLDFSRALLVSCIMIAGAFAQPSTDPSLWNVVQNPGGQRAVPSVYYNEATQILSVDTRDLNGLSETVFFQDNVPIQKDDVGLISLLVIGPLADTFPWFQSWVFGDAWETQYLAGRMQTIGSFVMQQFLLPGVYNVYQYPAGTTTADLLGNHVEIAVNFERYEPGAVLLGRVQAWAVPKLMYTGTCNPGVADRCLLFTGICSSRRLAHEESPR